MPICLAPGAQVKAQLVKKHSANSTQQDKPKRMDTTLRKVAVDGLRKGRRVTRDLILCSSLPTLALSKARNKMNHFIPKHITLQGLSTSPPCPSRMDTLCLVTWSEKAFTADGTRF